MNYFSHGIRFVERPYFLAGTAVPDWLRVSDHGVRVRAKHVAPFITQDGSVQAELAAGIAQHLADDDLFHGTGAFIQITAQISILFRNALPTDEGLRPSFLGHVASELILDGILIDRYPELLRAYYDALLQVDPSLILAGVNAMTREPAQRLAEFIPLFHREQFLWDYGQSRRLLSRLNQVLRRVKLPPLPAETVGVLDAARVIVEHNFENLLPFPLSSIQPR